MNKMQFREFSPHLFQKLVELGMAIGPGTLGQKIYHLVDIRASQINGCTFCLDMHIKQAKIHGEGDLRLFHVSVWRESHLFSDKERAALEWTEAVTRLTDHQVDAALKEKVLKHLSEKELSDLTFKIGVINAWNRLNISFPSTPGSLDVEYGLTKAGL